jgi:hypothetical protein
VTVTGEGKVACLLPAFFFDGECHTEIQAEKASLRITYEGWQCRYTTDGQILDLNRLGGNRNGHYKAFCASGENRLQVCIRIEKTEE